MQHYNTDHDVIQHAHDWLLAGYDVLLFTVLKTWGSSPRPIGSLMLLRSDGVIYGSVSGGCVEEDLRQRYCDNQLSDTYPGMIDYGVNRDEASRLGLPCGGRLELLVEKLTDTTQLKSLLEALQQQQLLVRRVDLKSGEVSLQPATKQQDFIYQSVSVEKVFGPQWQMLLIGAGQLSQYVTQIAQMLGYQVIVCDPRDEYTQEWSIQGVQIIQQMPDEAVQQFARQPRSIILALTHDPRLDDMALMDALGTAAFYVGAIGSQRNCEARRKRLLQLGLSMQDIERLHAPVGLDIGSHTPAEIALSIMAEITRERNQCVTSVPSRQAAALQLV